MRIGVIVDNDFNSDARVIKEAKLLADIGHEVHVLCYGYKGKTYPDIAGIKIHRCWVSMFWKKKSFFFYHLIPAFKFFWIRHITHFINKVKPEMIHAHDLYMSKVCHKGIEKSTLKNKIGLVLDLHENFPVAVKSYNWTHGTLRSLLAQPSKWGKLEKEYLSYADKIITLSEDFKEVLSNKFPILNKENIYIIPNVPDINEFNTEDKNMAPLPWTHPNAKVFFYFGIIAERRGIFSAIKAFEDLISSGEDLNMLLIGPVDKADKSLFNDKTRKHIETGRLIYIPWIELAELANYMKLGDVGLAPFVKNDQHDSGIANKIFQYMYGSLPIIASNCKPQQELIEKEAIGAIFSNQDELTELMKSYSKSTNLDEIGQRAKEALMEKYNMTLYKDTMKNIYSD